MTKSETLVRRGKKWFRYDAPDKRLFQQMQKTLTALTTSGARHVSTVLNPNLQNVAKDVAKLGFWPFPLINKSS